MNPFSHYSLWGNKNWPPSMKLKNLKILWNKMFSLGCKWFSLNGPGAQSPLSHPILELSWATPHLSILACTGEKFITLMTPYRTTRFPDVVPCSNSTLWTPSLKWISQTATKSPVPTSSIAICGMEGEGQGAGSGDDALRVFTVSQQTD